MYVSAAFHPPSLTGWSYGPTYIHIYTQDISKVDTYSEGSTVYNQCFEVISSKDQQRRVFEANSTEEAKNWIAAINAAIRNRAAYRRETINGLSFLHSEDDAPNISLISLKRVDGTETVLTKAPQCWYGTKFDVTCLAKANQSTTSEGDVIHVLMGNGAIASVSLKVLLSKAVGDTVPVRVNTPANHVANLAFSIEAFSLIKPSSDQGPKVRFPPHIVRHRLNSSISHFFTSFFFSRHIYRLPYFPQTSSCPWLLLLYLLSSVVKALLNLLMIVSHWLSSSSSRLFGPY